jgi:EAL domain-containing protein (putative c-di-GMP-specific phosphodiesterase class I)
MIDDRSIAYSEIQTCWLHPEIGMLDSREFYPIADELSVMHDIELLTLMQACKQIYKDSTQLPILIKVSINELLSGRTLKNLETLSLQIASIPYKLQVAVMEEEIASREIAVAKQLELISAMKITIVLDNFSVGGMSLTKLSKLPIDIIRFHEEFTLSLNTHATSSQNKDFTAYLLTCAKHAKYRVICKGVNNLDTVMKLLALGCDFVQDLPIHLISKSSSEKANVLL